MTSVRTSLERDLYCFHSWPSIERSVLGPRRGLGGVSGMKHELGTLVKNAFTLSVRPLLSKQLLE